LFTSIVAVTVSRERWCNTGRGVETSPLSTCGAFVTDPAEGSTIPLRTLSGRLSRLPPNTEAGARALMEAFVSAEFRRRRFEDEARVRMDASSVKILFAVADVYVVG
jgi:hypothetical protein